MGLKRFEKWWVNDAPFPDAYSGEHAWKALLVIIANKDYDEESLTQFIENELDSGKEVE